MIWAVVMGSLSLGAVIGWLVRYFIRRFGSFTPKALGSVVSVVAGGAAVRLLATNESAIWFYFMGLLLGFAVYHITFVVERNRAEKSSGHAAASEPDPLAEDQAQSSPPSGVPRTGVPTGNGTLYAPSGPPGAHGHKKL